MRPFARFTTTAAPEAAAAPVAPLAALSTASPGTTPPPRSPNHRNDKVVRS